MDLKSAPDQDCPECVLETRLSYLDSNTGNAADGRPFQHDYYNCPRCHKHFQYNHETGRLGKAE
jgi:hypothetical protein